MLTLGSLFDGIGGWQIAAIRAGAAVLWSSEIEPFPCAVTKKHFPETVQLGDITKLDGAKLWPVDIICAGSPCQDLSVAGKQEGLKGERSGLFRDAIRLVRDMRRASGGQAPRFFVWENVPGAFSSNKGLDFRAVLEEIGQTSIPMPEGAKWANAGLAELPTCDIAWRVLDAQYWGVPQRRKRIFLVVDFAAERRCAGQVLFEWQSLHGNIEESGETREGTAAGTENRIGNTIVRLRAGKPGGGKGALISKEKSLSLKSDNDQVLFVPDKARSLTARADGSPCVDRGPEIIAAVSYAIAGNIIGRENQNGGHHMGVDKDVSFTLNTVDRHAVYSMQRSDQFRESQVSHTLAARDYKSFTDLVAAVDCRNGTEGAINGTLQAKPNGGTSLNLQNVVRVQKTVRRLTPTECERLQGLPDGYTLIDDKSCSDSARYKALGNGMAQPCADYVIRRIVEVCDVGEKETDGGAD